MGFIFKRGKRMRASVEPFRIKMQFVPKDKYNTPLLGGEFLEMFDNVPTVSELATKFEKISKYLKSVSKETSVAYLKLEFILEKE